LFELKFIEKESFLNKKTKWETSMMKGKQARKITAAE